MENKVRVSLVIKSHINDATIEMIHNPELAYEHLTAFKLPSITSKFFITFIY